MTTAYFQELLGDSDNLDDGEFVNSKEETSSNSELLGEEDGREYATDERIVREKKRSRIAVQYENKSIAFLSTAGKALLPNPNTVADGAAIVCYGPNLANKLGDLAAADKRVRKMIDFVSDGADNPYAGVIIAAAPIVLQALRNHEPELEVRQRGIKIPFTKGRGENGDSRRLRFKFGIRVKNIRPLTHDPLRFARSILTQPGIMSELQEQGIPVALAEYGYKK